MGKIRRDRYLFVRAFWWQASPTRLSISVQIGNNLVKFGSELLFTTQN